MTPMRHALAARMLIKACGGLEAAAEACRLSKTQLGNFQDAELVQDPDPTKRRFMPADVIYDLEETCGQKIYTRMLMGGTAKADPNATLMGEACQLAVAATDTVAKISASLADGAITSNERKQMEQALLNLAQLLARTTTALSAAGGEG